MFGMGFTEIVIIAIIAILFLGPDKLPEAMVQIAKFFKSVKQTVGTAKESIEHELNVADIKEEALNYKKQLTDASSKLNDVANFGDLNDEFNDLKDDIVSSASDNTQSKKTPSKTPKPEVVTFAKETKKKNEKLVDGEDV
ncbi:MAG: Sec-independent protein translocase protein TatB [Campylobacterota bacterium]|nr:Sec-independent protein translocase protein TatB [Campylobacterota bacterium]